MTTEREYGCPHVEVDRLVKITGHKLPDESSYYQEEEEEEDNDDGEEIESLINIITEKLSKFNMEDMPEYPDLNALLLDQDSDMIFISFLESDKYDFLRYTCTKRKDDRDKLVKFILTSIGDEQKEHCAAKIIKHELISHEVICNTALKTFHSNFDDGMIACMLYIAKRIKTLFLLENIRDVFLKDKPSKYVKYFLRTLHSHNKPLYMLSVLDKKKGILREYRQLS